MRTFWWILVCGMVLALMQYSLFKEAGQPRQFGFSVKELRK